MKKSKIFIACDTANISKVRKIISETRNSKIKVGYKFGLEFLNSKNGRNFVSKLRNKVIFADLKLNDIPNTCASTLKSIKDLKINYLTIHISSGLEALKSSKRVAGKTKLAGVTILTSLDNKALKEIGFDRKVEILVVSHAINILFFFIVYFFKQLFAHFKVNCFFFWGIYFFTSFWIS